MENKTIQEYSTHISKQDAVISKLETSLEEEKEKNTRLEKKLKEKAETINIASAPTAETKTVKYFAPTRTWIDVVYARPKLQDVEISATDKKGIKELENKGYKLPA